MNKTSSRLLVFSFALLLASMNGFAQRGPGPGQDRDRRDDRRDERRDDRREDRYEDRFPVPQPQRERQMTAYSTLHLQVNQTIYARGTIFLGQLIKQQHGLSLKGAQIERVTVFGGVTRHRQANLQVEINNRPASMMRFLRRGHSMLPVDSREEMNSLQLEVMGDAQIDSIIISVGQVRPEFPDYNPYPSPYPTSIVVNKMVSAQSPLALSSLLPYESRMVESIVIEAQSRANEAELAALSDAGEFLGKVDVQGFGFRKVLKLKRPVMLRNLNLHSFSPVMVEKIEINFAY